MACLLTVYQGGTTQLANTYQDIGLVIPTTNPLVADASGRIPLFFVADGIYGLRLTDQDGIQSNGGFFYPQIPSIGASTSGGGGSAVDPNSIFATGDWKWRPSTETLAGWVRLNGRTIGNASSGASERANADTQALFIYAWGTYDDTKCAVAGGRGASALADFNASKQITLLDMRARGPIGVDDMGNAASGRLTSTNFPGSPDSKLAGGAYGGEGSHTLTTAELAPHTHGGTGRTGDDNPDHTHVVQQAYLGGSPGLSSGSFQLGNGAVQSGGASNRHQHDFSFTTNTGAGISGSAHNNFHPFVLGSHYWKL